MSGETRIIYHIDEEDTPYLVKVPVPIDRVTLADFKSVLCRPNYKFFFKSLDDEFGEVKEEIVDDDATLPSFNGKVISWLVSSEGSNVSDSNSQCADSIAPSEIRRPVGRPLPRGLRSLSKPLPPPDDTTCTESESVISSRRGFNLPTHKIHRRDAHFRMDKYSRFDGLNGKYRGQQNYESSLLSSDLETTTFLESDDDDASSRITATTEHSSVSRVMARQQQQRRQRRRKHRPQALSRCSSNTSLTDSTMSLNIITVTLNMNQDDNGPNFLGISIVGESNKGGDGGIYVGSIMKGGAVAKEGRIEPGDMILQVNDTNFENMNNDEAVRFLREVVQRPGPVKLVVAKCWDSNPKGYFTIPRTEPVRPIDPEAWVAHVAHVATGEYPPRPPSVTTMTSTGSSITSSLPETERTVEEVIIQLTVNTPMQLIVREMQKPDSGLEIRDRNWLKINIPNAFIGADVVDWLLTHVKGFVERKEARKFAAQLLKRGFIRHTVNKLTFSEQCYYIFGEIVPAMANLRIREDDKDSDASDPCGHLPPPSSASIGWSNPYSSSTLTNGAPLYAPMPYMTGGYESNAYSYPQEQSLHSGSGGSSDTTGSRKERQHLVRDNHSHGVPMGYSAPLEMRAMDSDSDSNRSRKSGSSVLMQIPMNGPQIGNLPATLPPSYANAMMLANQAHANGDVTNHNQRFGGPSHSSGNPNEFFVDVM